MDGNLHFKILEIDNVKPEFFTWLFDSLNYYLSRSYLFSEELKILKFDNYGNLIEELNGNFICSDFLIDEENQVKFKLKQI